MTRDEVISLLTVAGHAVMTQIRLKNDSGWQLRLDNDAIVNVYDKGTVNVQGKNQDEIEELLGIHRKSAGEPIAVSPGKRKVFVVYGHDQGCRDQPQPGMGPETLADDRAAPDQ